MPHHDDPEGVRVQLEVNSRDQSKQMTFRATVSHTPEGQWYTAEVDLSGPATKQDVPDALRAMADLLEKRCPSGPGSDNRPVPAIGLYRHPFRYNKGYIFDADDKIVVGKNAGYVTMVWGLGRIVGKGYAEEMRDRVGELIAEALSEFWGRRQVD